MTCHRRCMSLLRLAGLAWLALLGDRTSAAPLQSSRRDDLGTSLTKSPRTIRLPVSQRRFKKARPGAIAILDDGDPDGLGGANDHERTTRKRQQPAGNDTQAELLNWEDARYITTIVIAGEQLDVVLDTGSSDTFVYSVQPSMFTGIPESELPPLFQNGTAQSIENANLTYEAKYGGGNGILTTAGAIQFANVSLTGTDLDVRRQAFANLYESSNGIGASGLLGLGFPIGSSIWLEAVLNSIDVKKVYPSLNDTKEFFPLVLRLHEQGEIAEPIFSLELERIGPSANPNLEISFNYTENQGTLTIGGYPENRTESDFTWSPVPYVIFPSDYRRAGFPASSGNRWTTPIEAIYFNDNLLPKTRLQPNFTADGGNLYGLIDSGNPTMVLPPDTLASITDAWAANPRNIVMDCNARFDLVFQIAGKNFTMNKVDMLVPYYEAIDSLNYRGNPISGCQFQAQPDDPTPDEWGAYSSITYALGDPFMRNVITAFDYGSVYDAASSPPRMGFLSKIQGA